EELLEKIGCLKTFQENLRLTQEEYRVAAEYRDRIGGDYREAEQHFLNAQAGILALPLKEGSPCPVCGSIHHPNLAKIPDTAPTKEEVGQKKEQYSEAERKVEGLSAKAGHWHERLKEQKQVVLRLADHILGGDGVDENRENIDLFVLQEWITRKGEQIDEKEKELALQVKKAQEEQKRREELDRLQKEGEEEQAKRDALLQQEGQALAAVKGKLEEACLLWERMVLGLSFPESVGSKEEMEDYLRKQLSISKKELTRAEEDKKRQEMLTKEVGQGEEQKMKIQEKINEKMAWRAEQTGQIKTLTKQIGRELEKAGDLCGEAVSYLVQHRKQEVNKVLFSFSFSGEDGRQDGQEDVLQMISGKLQLAFSAMQDCGKALKEVAGRLTESIARRRELEAKQQQTEKTLSDSKEKIRKLEKELEGIKSLRRDRAQQLFKSLCAQDPGRCGKYQQADEIPDEVLGGIAGEMKQECEERLGGLLGELEENRGKLLKKQHLEQGILDRGEKIKALDQQIQESHVFLAGKLAECEAKKKEIDDLKQQLGAGSKETVKEQIRLLEEKRGNLESMLKTAKEEYDKCKTQKDGLTASIEMLQKQIFAAGAAADTKEEAVRERNAKWQQEKKELGRERDGKKSAIFTNRDILKKASGQQEAILEVEEKYIWIKALSDTAKGNVKGKSKMELETYVQMAYFDRILRRANLRLLTMSGGQYELMRETNSGNLKEKTGLELCVIDHYNATKRSVKTLSGGESFEASLSLALGLSDEIQSCAGGIRIESMFIDEGFGSLDEDALNQAMKALMRLTEGSRLVGVISHVSELKERIEKKIIVTKYRNRDQVGSRIEME
ncbi:MAG: hypothetical protein K2N63_15735, partial [Lachnospiraceae bacterium]|nr:hypothetical protein [Lachnospiraceae bacterium]